MKSPATVSRRSLVAGAAALPVAAIGTPAFADAELLAMEPVFTERWNGVLGPLLDQLERAEKAMSEWKRQNPQPQLPERSLSEDERRACAELQKAFAANGPDEATKAKHDAERANWEKRKATAECQTGKAAAHERQSAFWDEHALLVEKLSEMQATTMDGLKVKARLALMMDEEDLAWSIVEDLAAAR